MCGEDWCTCRGGVVHAKAAPAGRADVTGTPAAIVFRPRNDPVRGATLCDVAQRDKTLLVAQQVQLVARGGALWCSLIREKTPTIRGNWSRSGAAGSTAVESSVAWRERIRLTKLGARLNDWRDRREDINAECALQHIFCCFVATSIICCFGISTFTEECDSKQKTVAGGLVLLTFTRREGPVHRHVQDADWIRFDRQCALSASSDYITSCSRADISFAILFLGDAAGERSMMSGGAGGGGGGGGRFGAVGGQ